MDNYLEIQKINENRKQKIESYNQAVEDATRKQMSELVRTLVAARKEQEKTQQDIANATGMAAPNIARIESCRRIPTIQALKKYAEVLGYKVEVQLVKKK